jgi:hypothetical protein
MSNLEEAREKIAGEVARFHADDPKKPCSFCLKIADGILDLPLVSGLSIRQLREMKGELLTDEEIKAAEILTDKERTAIRGEVDKFPIVVFRGLEENVLTVALRKRKIARAQLLKCHLHDAQVRRETAKEIFEQIEGRKYPDEYGSWSVDIEDESYKTFRDKYLKGE